MKIALKDGQGHDGEEDEVEGPVASVVQLQRRVQVRRRLRPAHHLDSGRGRRGLCPFQNRVGEGRVGQEHGHGGGALHPQPGAGRAERDVDQRLVQRFDAGPVGAHDPDQLPLDVARGGLRRQDHPGPRAQPQPLGQRLAEEGVEAVAVFQVASVHHLFAQLGERQFGRGVDPDDVRRQRAFGRRRQATRAHAHRSQRRIGERGLGDRCQRRLHLRGAHAIVQALAVAVPGRVEGDVPRAQAYTRVDPVLVSPVGEGARKDQQRETHRHGGGGQGAAAHFAAQGCAARARTRVGRRTIYRLASASAGGTRTARQAGSSAETTPVPTRATALTNGPHTEYSTVSMGRTAEPAKE